MLHQGNLISPQFKILIISENKLTALCNFKNSFGESFILPTSPKHHLEISI